MAASKVALLQRLDGRLAVGADGDLVAQPRQLGAHELLQRPLVVGEQDAQTFWDAKPGLLAVSAVAASARRRPEVDVLNILV